jgi:hypothetical protein
MKKESQHSQIAIHAFNTHNFCVPCTCVNAYACSTDSKTRLRSWWYQPVDFILCVLSCIQSIVLDADKKDLVLLAYCRRIGSMIRWAYIRGWFGWIAHNPHWRQGNVCGTTRVKRQALQACTPHLVIWWCLCNVCTVTPTTKYHMESKEMLLQF